MSFVLEAHVGGIPGAPNAACEVRCASLVAGERRLSGAWRTPNGALPDAEAAGEGVAVCSPARARRECAQARRVAAAQYDVVGLEGRSQMRDRFCDQLFPALAAELDTAPFAEVVLECALLERQVAELHRLDDAVGDQRRSESGTEAEEEHGAALVASERLHRGVVHDPGGRAEGRLEVESDPSRAEVEGLRDHPAVVHRGRDADGHDIEAPVLGGPQSGSDHLGGREGRPRRLASVLSLAAQEHLDVRTADVDRENSPFLNHRFREIVADRVVTRPSRQKGGDGPRRRGCAIPVATWQSAVMADPAAGALVAFGITGDLAKVMTFRSLYRLERRGLLNCRVIGVAIDDWTTPGLRRHMRDSIRASGERVERTVFDRLASRVSYLQGDFSDPATFERVGKLVNGLRNTVFYLETPPALFGPIVTQLGNAGLTAGARVLIEKPFGHDLASARALASELHHSVDEEQIFRVDHFLGKLGLGELLYLRYANTILEPVWNARHISSVQITMAERFGVEDRGRFYDAVGALRDVVVNHLLQLAAAATMDAPGAGETIEDARHRLLRSMADADPARYVRGQYAGYRTTPGVAPRSTTETFAALELRIDNERWHGVPVYIRTGKHLPITQTEVRLVFRDASPLTFLAKRNRPSPNELVVRLDPGTGIRLILEAHRADASGAEPITLDMEFAEQGGEGATAYEVIFQAALEGDRSLFIRQETVEEAWRIVAPLLGARKRTHIYRKGSWGPPQAATLLGRGKSWRSPWTV